jgi:hypothetical protein
MLNLVKVFRLDLLVKELHYLSWYSFVNRKMKTLLKRDFVLFLKGMNLMMLVIG